MQTQVLEKLRTLYEGIRDERGTHANTATRIGNAFLALLSYLAGAPFLRKDQDDSTPHKLTMGAAEVRGDASIKGDTIVGKEGFAGGLAGFGIRLGKNGMILRRFLEVPELRYNRVEVYVGNQWRAPGAGIIESVTPDTNSDGTESATGEIKLKLEEGEIGKVAVDDICMGIFHDHDGGQRRRQGRIQVLGLLHLLLQDHGNHGDGAQLGLQIRASEVCRRKLQQAPVGRDAFCVLRQLHEHQPADLPVLGSDL